MDTLTTWVHATHTALTLTKHTLQATTWVPPGRRAEPKDADGKDHILSESPYVDFSKQANLTCDFGSQDRGYRAWALGGWWCRVDHGT